MSQIIFRNAHYTACTMKDDSLVVTKNRTQSGRRLIGEKALEWVAAIKSAIDPSEAAALCRALFNQ